MIEMRTNDYPKPLLKSIAFLQATGLGQTIAFEASKVRDILTISDLHAATKHISGITMFYEGQPIPIVDCRPEADKLALAGAGAIIANVLTCNVAIVVNEVHGKFQVPCEELSADVWEGTSRRGMVGCVFYEYERTFLIDLDIVIGPSVKTFLLHRKSRRYCA